MNNLYNTFQELIEIPSITRNKEEKEIVGFTEEKLKKIVESNENLSWVKITIEKIENIDNNWIYHWGVICNIKADENYKNIWLMGHLDVVPVSKNWNTNPFKLVEENDRFLWRWTCDMKSWDAIMIEMLRESLKNKPTKNITLIFTSWEEKWIPNWLTEIINSKQIWNLDFAIALEPTNWKINTWVFWYLDSKFNFKWKACHSSNPSLWENAISKAWPFLTYLHSPDCIEAYDIYNTKLNEAFSATKIEWWIASNIIPDKAVIQTNLRYSPNRNWEEAEKLMRDLAKKYQAEKIEIIEHNPSSQIVRSDNLHLLEFIEKIKASIQDLNVVPFWSDISQTSKLWIPSINFWPWSIEQAHTDNEFILKNSFEKTYKQFKNYLFN